VGAELAQLAGGDDHLTAGRDDVLDHEHPAPGDLGALGEPRGAVLLGLLADERARQLRVPAQRRDHGDPAHL
jgi:hypothetical protein